MIGLMLVMGGLLVAPGERAYRPRTTSIAARTSSSFAASARGRCHRAPRLDVGHPASPEPRHRRAAFGCSTLVTRDCTARWGDCGAGGHRKYWEGRLIGWTVDGLLAEPDFATGTGGGSSLARFHAPASRSPGIDTPGTRWSGAPASELLGDGVWRRSVTGGGAPGWSCSG